ncbi:energy transducer TonB [Paludibacterium purpuratum]|uniref:Protein TonB n=1 Tax=Paludibacterium purpuratum TaxID=1144873 RepID=A0A4R7B3U8_9NEIS|nr:energy transducer TonB [Paludibacterium purpuratum]TDR78476.1 protein TonB [Paludibacterium purpuratum]
MKSARTLILALVLSLLAHWVLLSVLSAPHSSEPPVLQVVLTTAVGTGQPPGSGARSAPSVAARTAKPRIAAISPPSADAAKSAVPTTAPSVAPSLSPAVATPAVSPATGSAATNVPLPVGAGGQTNGKASAISPARYLGDAQHPPYPERARERGVEGRVEAMVTVAVDGRVQEVALLHSSGFDELDQAALDLLRKGPYTPAQRAGVAVASRLRMAVPFRLAH